MAIDSKNLVGAGLALAIVGIAAWATSALMSSSSPVATPTSAIEVRPLAFSVDGQDQPAPSESGK
jgi:flagellar biogenesis protein FliO